MEWFQIFWSTPYTITTATAEKASDNFGVYAIFEKSRSFKLLYIGETYWQTFAKRLQQHRREWLDRVKGQIVIAFGSVLLSTGKRISYARISDVEKALIHYFHPPYNTISKRGYSGRDILIFNTGKSCLPERVVCLEPQLLTLLKKSLR